MATVKKRSWGTAEGHRKEAWRVRYVDQHGATRTRQFAKKGDADAFRIKAESEVVNGVHTPDRQSITIKEAAANWIETADANGRERGTLKAYREMAALHIVPLLGDEKLSRLSQPKVEAFKDALLRTRSQAMAGKAVRALSMIIAEAMRRGFVAQNVARGVTVRRSKREKARPIIPSKADLRALIDGATRLECQEPCLAPLVRVALIGLRQSELRGLAWNDIDLKTGRLTVSQRADRWQVIGEPKSEAGARTVPFGPDLASALRKWKLRCPPSGANLVFPNRKKGVLDQKRMATLLLMLEIEAGLAVDSGKKDADGATIWARRYGWHHLRHAAASGWIAQRIDLKRLQVWIGHSTIQLTIDTYGHLMADEGVDASLANGAEAALLGA